MVNILQLNLDVIHAIMSHIDPQDVFPLALTCTSMQEVAMRRYLAHVEIHDCTEEALGLFCSCMARNAHRPQYLLSIAITSWPRDYVVQPMDQPKDSDTMVRLSHIISQATQLSELVWLARGSSLPAPDCLLNAITGIRTLSAVTLSLPREDLRRVFSGMKSRPHTIMCMLADTENQSWNLARDLCNFADAGPLHTLSLKVKEALTLTTGEHWGDVRCWPSVKNLTIDRYGVIGSPLDLSLLSRAFSGVKWLGLFQEPKDFTAEPFTWPSVDFLRTAFPVKLTTAVRHVNYTLYNKPRRDDLLEMLGRLRPSVLECEVDGIRLSDLVDFGLPVKFLQLSFGPFDEYDGASAMYNAIVRITSGACHIAFI